MNSEFEICKFQAKAHMSTCAVFALRSSIQKTYEIIGKLFITKVRSFHQTNSN